STNTRARSEGPHAIEGQDWALRHSWCSSGSLQEASARPYICRLRSLRRGILRTMGATQGAIMRIFLITGASIGVVGTLTGAALRVVFCWKIDAIRWFVASLTDTAVGSRSRRCRGRGWPTPPPRRSGAAAVRRPRWRGGSLAFPATQTKQPRSTALDQEAREHCEVDH